MYDELCIVLCIREEWVDGWMYKMGSDLWGIASWGVFEDMGGGRV